MMKTIFTEATYHDRRFMMVKAKLLSQAAQFFPPNITKPAEEMVKHTLKIFLAQPKFGQGVYGNDLTFTLAGQKYHMMVIAEFVDNGRAGWTVDAFIGFKDETQHLFDEYRNRADETED